MILKCVCSRVIRDILGILGRQVPHEALPELHALPPAHSLHRGEFLEEVLNEHEEVLVDTALRIGLHQDCGLACHYFLDLVQELHTVVYDFLREF